MYRAFEDFGLQFREREGLVEVVGVCLPQGFDALKPIAEIVKGRWKL